MISAEAPARTDVAIADRMIAAVGGSRPAVEEIEGWSDGRPGMGRHPYDAQATWASRISWARRCTRGSDGTGRAFRNISTLPKRCRGGQAMGPCARSTSPIVLASVEATLQAPRLSSCELTLRPSNSMLRMAACPTSFARRLNNPRHTIRSAFSVASGGEGEGNTGSGVTI